MEMQEKLLAVGNILCDAYILRARLGHGDLGEVWLADELYEGGVLRSVVVNALSPNILNVQEDFSQIQTAFHNVHSLQHQHIRPLFAIANDQNVGTIIVSKFIDGIALPDYYAQYVGRHDRFPLQEVVRLLKPIAQALDYSHSKKVLHRNVKPQSVIVCKDPSDGVQLVDFGLVMELSASPTSWTSSSSFSFSGILPYAAPERWIGAFQDAASDQFSLAVVVYELLAGRLPFTGDDRSALCLQILNKTPDAIPNAPNYVNFVLQTALAKDPKQRFATCEEFIEALEKPPVEPLAPVASTAPQEKTASEPAENLQTQESSVKNGALKVLLTAGASVALVLGIALIEPMNKKLAKRPSETVTTATAVSEEAPVTKIPFLSPPVINPEPVNPAPGNPAPVNPSPEQTPNPSPELTPNPSPELTPNPSPELTPNPSPELTPNPSPELTPNPSPELTPALEPEQTPTPSPAQGPEQTPTPSPTQGPEQTPSPTPDNPSGNPTSAPGSGNSGSGNPAPVAAPSPRELLEIADGAIKVGHFDEAFEAFSRIDLKAINDDQLEIFALVCRATGEETKEAEVRKALSKRFKPQEEFQRLSQRAESPDEYRRLIELCDSLLQDDPGNIKYLRARLHARIMDKTFSASMLRDECDELVERYPSNSSFRAERGLLYLQNLGAFPKATEEAKKNFENILAADKDPENQTALLYLGILHYKIHRKFKGAIGFFDKILAVNPKNYQALLFKGIVCFEEMKDRKNKDYSVAKECLTDAIRLMPYGQKPYEFRGQIYFETSEYRNAIQDFSMVLLKDPQNIEIRLLRGATRLKLKLWEDAIQDFKYLLEIDKKQLKHVVYYRCLEKCYRNRKNIRKSQEMQNEANKLERGLSLADRGEIPLVFQSLGLILE